MDLDFSNLKEAAIRSDATRWVTLPLKGSPQLRVASLTDYNDEVVDAAIRDNVRGRATRKVKASDAPATKASEVRDRRNEVRRDDVAKLALVIKGWRGIVNAAGAEVPFSPDAALRWLEALLDHGATVVFDVIKNFCTDPFNFTEGALREEDIEAFAGNSEGG